jgi:hypothetical protein
MASTNEPQRNLGEVYLSVLISVMSVVIVVGKPWTRRIGFETLNGGLEFLRRIKFRCPAMGVLQYLVGVSFPRKIIVVVYL